MSSSLHTSKLAIVVTGSIVSTKHSTDSNNLRYYGPTISKTLSLKSALNSLSQMNPYSSMTKMIPTSFSLSTLTTSSHLQKPNKKSNLYSMNSPANSNYAILGPSRNSSASTSIGLHLLVQFTCLNQPMHEKCFINSTWQNAIL